MSPNDITAAPQRRFVNKQFRLCRDRARDRRIMEYLEKVPSMQQSEVIKDALDQYIRQTGLETYMDQLEEHVRRLGSIEDTLVYTLEKANSQSNKSSYM